MYLSRASHKVTLETKKVEQKLKGRAEDEDNLDCFVFTAGNHHGGELNCIEATSRKSLSHLKGDAVSEPRFKIVLTTSYEVR